MIRQNINPVDLSTKCVVVTSSSDGSVAFPVPPTNPITNAKTSMSWFLLLVEGSAAYINQGAAATSANAAWPVGVYGPFYIATQVGDGKLHALQVTAPGQVSLIQVSAT